MTDSEELDRIRERKRQRLIEEEHGQDTGSASPAAAATAPDDPIHIEGADHLEEVVGTYDVVLADFYADWCGPCQMLAPIVEELAASTPAAVAKIDVDANQALAGEYQVRGVPTLVLFADGAVAERLTGARDRDTLERLIGQYAG